MTVHQAKNVILPIMNLLRIRSVPILEQLKLEERLLRNSLENWCIINNGTPQPTIVMGASGRAYELINLKSAIRDQVPVIRRFTGGGTVIVDKETIFVTLICNKDSVPYLQPYPEPIMSWTGRFYSEVFDGFGEFHLRENDYAFNYLKFGGNAQSITKNRWVHHTSFLWDYDVKNMEYLKLPSRAPKYRSARSHEEFLCRMKEIMPNKSCFIERTINALEKQFSVQPMELDNIGVCNKPYTSSTKLLTKQELEKEYHSLLNIIA